jgi:hypothetical protein
MVGRLAVSAILSLPWSPLASLPPDVDVPLPLLLGFMELPVVGDVEGFAELDAGSPVTDPLPLGICDCARANPRDSTKAALGEMTAIFMKVPLDSRAAHALNFDLVGTSIKRATRHEPFGYRQCTALECLEGDLLREHHVASDQGSVRHETPAHSKTISVIEFVHIHGGAVVNSIFPSGVAPYHIEVPPGVELLALMRR